MRLPQPSRRLQTGIEVPATEKIPGIWPLAGIDVSRGCQSPLPRHVAVSDGESGIFLQAVKRADTFLSRLRCNHGRVALSRSQDRLTGFINAYCDSMDFLINCEWLKILIFLCLNG
jgi:hypothetical protein